MKLIIPNTPYILAAVTVLCALTAASAQISKNLASERAHKERQAAMETVARHVMSNTCMKVTAGDTLLIGDSIALRKGGKSPTSCIKAQGHYAHAAYLNGDYVVTQVFSLEEIQAIKSQIKEQK